MGCSCSSEYLTEELKCFCLSVINVGSKKLKILPKGEGQMDEYLLIAIILSHCKIMSSTAQTFTKANINKISAYTH